MSRLIFSLLVLGVLQLVLAKDDWKLVKSTICYDKHYVNDLLREIVDRRLQIYDYQIQTDKYVVERADVLKKENNLKAEIQNLTSELDRSKHDIKRLAGSIVEKYRRDHNLANNNTDTLNGACINNHTTVVEAMLDLGVDIDLPIISEQGKCLHQAAINNNVYLAKLLIQRGANINARTSPETNWTPLMTSSWYGNLEVAKLLLDHGADLTPRAKNNGDRTALGLAKYYNKSELIELLQSKGAPE